MSQKHTPGPWDYDRQLADNGDKSTEMIGRGGHINEAVCIIPHDDITDAGYEEVKANARLIAAAPELLEALKLCKAELRYYPGDTNKEGDALIDNAYNAAEAAIAKATGGSK